MSYGAPLLRPGAMHANIKPIFIAPNSEHKPRRKREVRLKRRAEARGLTDDPLLNAHESAAEAGIAVATWWKWVRLGRFPQPLYPLPKSPRWRRSEVRAAIHL